MNSIGRDRFSELFDTALGKWREPEGASEFSHGPGLVPKQLAGNDPAHGGRYKPIPPEAKLKVAVRLNVYGNKIRSTGENND